MWDSPNLAWRARRSARESRSDTEDLGENEPRPGAGPGGRIDDVRAGGREHGSERTTIGLLLGGLGVAVALAGSPNALAAQADGETRSGWRPYLGCWEPQEAGSSRGVLCVVASGEDVEMLTIVKGAIQLREPFVADGRGRAVGRESCQGMQSARFSGDLRRLYTASRIACEGEAPRRSTGIIFMPDRDHWLDVRVVEIDGVTTAWSRRYRRTGDGLLGEAGVAVPAARVPSFALRGAVSNPSVPITIGAVIDASRNVDAKAVGAWLVAVGQEFRNLTRRR